MLLIVVRWIDALNQDQELKIIALAGCICEGYVNVKDGAATELVVNFSEVNVLN